MFSAGTPLAPMLPDPCDVPGAGALPACQVKKGVEEGLDSAAQAVEFGKDPFGYIAQKEAEAAKQLMEGLIPALAKVTQPDLTADWFINAYKVSFGCAIFGWVLIMLWDFATYRRRGESGDEVVDSALRWSPVFLIGSMFGPAVGAFLVRFIGALNTSLVRWGISSSSDEIVKGFNEMISDEPAKMLGGSFVAMIIYFCLILALLLVLIVLIVMLVTLYISGVVLPLSLMWTTKVGQREKGRKILMVWAGVLTSQPLIFLLLGFAFSGIAEQTFDVMKASDVTKGAPLQSLVQAVVVIIMLAIATLGPTGLLGFAPVGPTDGAAAGPGIDMRSAGQGKSGGRGGAGPSSPDASQTSQIASKNAASAPSVGGSASAGGAASAGGGSTAAAGAGGASATGGASLAAAAAVEGTKGLAETVQEMKGQAQQAGQSAADAGETGGGQAGSDKDGSGGGASGQSLSEFGSQGRPGGGASGQSLSEFGSQGRPGGGSGESDSGESSGRGIADTARDMGSKASDLAGKVSSLAQRAGDHAERQMDHHREEPRRR